jgi:hypothetical protein
MSRSKDKKFNHLLNLIDLPRRRECPPVAADLVDGSRDRQVLDRGWVLHYIHEQAATRVPGDMAVQGPCSRIVCMFDQFIELTVSWV